MAFMNNTVVNGNLLVRDYIALQDGTDDYIIKNNGDKNAIIGNDKLDLSINSKSININSNEKLNINSPKDIKLNTEENLFLNGSRICLNNSRFIYGTEDPNNLDIPNPREGMIYFKIMMD